MAVRSTGSNALLAGFVISFTGAILFSTKAILVKLAFRSTHTDALTLLALRMLLSLPFYVLTAFWVSRSGRPLATMLRCRPVLAAGCCGAMALCWPWWRR